MSTYDLVADLPVSIERYELEGLVQNVSSDFERKTTIIHLRGAGEEGLGEDVVYDAVDHEIAQKAGPTLALAGDWTIALLLRASRRRSTSSPRRPSARSPSSTASGPTSRRRSTSRCARPASRCTRCSAASRAH